MTDVSGKKPPECMGIDADSVGIDFAPGCLTCIATYCCTEAKACATNAECKQIIKCEASCYALGNTSDGCTEVCTGNNGQDAGAGSFDGCVIPNPAEIQAQSLDDCFVPHCASLCNPCGG